MKKLEILGGGCAKCDKLMELTEKAALEMGLEYEISKVSNFNDIARYGVMVTPALVVDGKVKVSGKVPSYDDIKEMLE